MLLINRHFKYSLTFHAVFRLPVLHPFCSHFVQKIRMQEAIVLCRGILFLQMISSASCVWGQILLFFIIMESILDLLLFTLFCKMSRVCVVGFSVIINNNNIIIIINEIFVMRLSKTNAAKAHIIIFWFCVAVAMSHLTNCITNSKVRAMSAKQTIHMLSCKGLST